MPRGLLFLIDELQQWRGTETHLLRLLERLDQRLFEPVVCIVGRAGLAARFESAGIEVHRLQAKRVLAPEGLVAQWRLARLIHRRHISLVVAYHTAADLLAPVAGGLQGVPVISCRRDEGFTKKPLHLLLQRRLNHLVRGMIAVSHATARAVEEQEGYPLRQIQVIWNGEDLERFSPGPSTLRTELGIAKEALVVGCVGGLAPVKGQRLLLDAFATLLEERSDCHLLLAGDGPDRALLERRAAALGGAVHLLGHRGDVERVLRACDIYCQTSRTEGFSNAVVQAMACALPTVVTAVGGNLELVTPACGVLVPVDDRPAVTRALSALMRRPEHAAALGRGGRERAERFASLSRMVAAYEDAFGRAISGSFPGASAEVPSCYTVS